MSIARLWFNLCERKDGIIYRREQLLPCCDITRVFPGGSDGKDSACWERLRAGGEGDDRG